MQTRIGIVGAGPAGLMLSHLLHLAGIESVVVESRSREYCETRVRAGLIEQWAADLLVATGVGHRLQCEGLFHNGIHLCFDRALHYVDFRKLVGRGVAIYGQQEIVKDLIARRIADGGQVLFEAEATAIADCRSQKPQIHFRCEGRDRKLVCDFVAGCDGSHGIARQSIPADALTLYERDYPFGWLGILSQSPPPERELIYAYHARGFALYTMRSEKLARLYLQCPPDDDVANWPDARIWEELHIRLGGTRALAEGNILQKAVTPMRSFVCEPMQYGRLFLAGDCAHIVPPTGAKGMNLALADVRVLARALEHFYRGGGTQALDDYSAACLPRAWKAQRFSWWMTQMLHRFTFENDFDMRRQLAELDYVATSQAAATSLAENYSGLPLE